MKYSYLIFLFLFFIRNSSAQNVYSASEGEVSFFSETPLENIEAHNKNVNSFIDVSHKQIAFVIPIRKFDFEKDLMEEHFNEKYLESDKYPHASFRGNITEDIDFSKEGKYKVTAIGKITIHGVERKQTYTGELVVKKGEIFLTSEFSVRPKDHNIIIPKIIYSNIAEVIAVKLKVKYIPYKNEKN